MRGRLPCCPAGLHAHRGTTSLTGALPAPWGTILLRPLIDCCDGLTRPVLLTPSACVAVGAFFRKLAGDSRVVAASESTISMAGPPIMERMQKNGTGWRDGPRPRKVSWWSVSAAVLAAPGAVLLALRLVPWDIGTPWIQLLAVFPAALITTTAGLAAAVVALPAKPRPGRTLVAALAAVV